MANYWWLILLPVLVLIVAPLGSAAFEWNALKTRGVDSSGGMASSDSHSADRVADFVWLGMLLTAFLILFRLQA